MAWWSMLWATNTTGDGAVAGYSEDQTTQLYRALFLNDPTNEGILKNYLNEAEVTATNHAVTPYVTVDTGAAIVYGFPAFGDVSENLMLTLPVVGDTGFRVVLQATHGATRTVRVALLQNTDGVAAIPALTQTAGTLWEIGLASGVLDTSGDVWMTSAKSVAGVTDLREFVHPNIEVEPAMVKNRTRKEWIPVVVGYNVTDGTQIVLSYPAGETVLEHAGIVLPDSKIARVVGSWMVPEDYVSGLTITAVVHPGANGNVYSGNYIRYGACGETIYNHSDGNPGTYAAEAVVHDRRNCVAELSLTTPTAGDMVSIIYTRNAVDALDTVSQVVTVIGFVAEYTADS